MKVILSGSKGFLGRRLRRHFEKKGDRLFPIQRVSSNNPIDDPIENDTTEKAIGWNVEGDWMDIKPMEDADIVIHLAGENIAGRWTVAKKRRIWKSRITGTRQLVDALSRLKKPPSSLFCASATGFYGDGGNELKDEKSRCGKGFLASLCAEWEAAATQAQSFGMRVILLRFGVILDPNGGALKKMLPPFRLGLGGKIGGGDQYFPWIAGDEIPPIIDFLIRQTSLSGPVNLVSPDCVTNADFTNALSNRLACPAFFHIPKGLIRVIFGEMGEETLLASCRAQPAILRSGGYQFRHSTLVQCLKSILP